MGLHVTADIVGHAATLKRFDELRDAIDGPTEKSVGTDVEYAPYQEFGTATIPAHPFLRPAREEVNATLGAYVERADSLEEATQLIAEEVRDRAKAKAPVETGRLRDSIELKDD